jgi:ribonuclease P protein component
VLRRGQRRAGRLLVVHALVWEGPARHAVIASRKVGSAVRRNRAKRLLREAARRVRWRADVAVALVARGPCADSGLDDVLAELRRLARELEVIDEP